MSPEAQISASAPAVMVGSYDLPVVALSILISLLAAYAALELAERITAARGRGRAWLWWVIGGGTASALGTWSMHYTGMLAFRLPVPVLYHWPTALLSYVPAVFSSAAALFLVNSWHIRWRRALVGSILIGGGISAMHYTAMAAMRFTGICRYSGVLVAVSVIIAIALSLVTLQLTFLFPDQVTAPKLRKIISILFFGAANPAMHYTGMAATTFLRLPEAPNISHSVNISLLGAEGITIVPIMALAVALVTCMVDRLRKQEALLERALNTALEASRLKSTFIANMTHEIRTPLNGIIGYTELIGEHLAEQNDDSLRDYLEGVQRACSRLSRTVDNILDISKIEARAFTLHKTRLDIRHLLEGLLSDFEVTAKRKGIGLTFIVEEPNAHVVFDEQCLTRAVTNLLDNAIKFTDRGAVTCRLTRAGDGRLCLEIRDSGIGISRDYLPHLFEPFSQEQSGDTRAFQGSGLGLALTRRYLEFNRAEIAVQSEKGKGTSFTIYFSRESEAESLSEQ